MAFSTRSSSEAHATPCLGDSALKNHRAQSNHSLDPPSQTAHGTFGAGSLGMNEPQTHKALLHKASHHTSMKPPRATPAAIAQDQDQASVTCTVGPLESKHKGLGGMFSARGIRDDHRSLRIAFIHPDLGIGGAERLVVDAAVGLKKLGHHVSVFTSSHDPKRCFVETIDGTLPVTVLGNSIFPRAFKNRLVTLMAILRQVHLSTHLLFSLAFGSCLAREGESHVGGGGGFDIYFVDQLSASIPLLKYGSRTRVLFYCHFPDLLLTPPSQPENHGIIGCLQKLKALYRLPLDWLEEFTTGQADRVLVNSKFTATVFKETFRRLKLSPRCVYPGVDVGLYNRLLSEDRVDPVFSFLKRHTILSINRFEKKKDIALLVQAFIILLSRPPLKNVPVDEKPCLVLAGGYDERLIDNRHTLQQLLDLITSKHDLIHKVIKDEEDLALLPSSLCADVLFFLNISHSNKLRLLTASSTKVLAYTASNEHLGIGPLEGMACALPVLATNSGGPKETVVHEVTGYLIRPEPQSWAEALERILNMDEQVRQRIGKAGQDRVQRIFSTEVMSREIEETIKEVLLNCDRKKLDIWMEVDFWKMLAAIAVPLISLWLGLWLKLKNA